MGTFTENVTARFIRNNARAVLSGHTGRKKHTMTDYEKQAQAFLEKTGTTFEAVFSHNGKYFPEDKGTRDIYNITLRRGERSYTFQFGQSIANSGKKGTSPVPYDVLSCLTKRSPGLFEEFCSDFGYDTDSRRAESTYQKVMEEWLHLTRLFSATELEEMEEIQ